MTELKSELFHSLDTYVWQNLKTKLFHSLDTYV